MYFYLVNMKPALHEDDPHTREFPNNELSLVSRGGAHREVGDLLVRQHHALLHQTGQAAQAGAADEAQHRPGALADGLQDVVSYRLEGLPGQGVRACCGAKC